jgi:predicted TIM-barrel enzyme
MMWTVALVGLLALTSALSTVDLVDTEVVESLRGVPPGWQSVGAPATDSRMRFKIALKLVRQFEILYLVNFTAMATLSTSLASPRVAHQSA